MPSLSRIGRLLFLLAIFSACVADLRAQFAQQAKLVGSNSMPRPSSGQGSILVPVAQGSSVALSADGNTAIVNGYGDDNGVGGAAWIFTRSNGIWSQQGEKLIGTGAVGVSLRTLSSR